MYPAPQSTRPKRKRDYQSERMVFKRVNYKLINYLTSICEYSHAFDELIQTETDQVVTFSDGDNMKEPYHLENGKFKRYATLLWKVPVPLLEQNLLDLIQERVDKSGDLQPDESQFEESEVHEWQEDFLVPQGSDLTPLKINRIKKGMLKGILYNMSISTLKQIFNKPTVTEWKPIPKGGFIRIVRCPLCPVELSLSKIYSHMEMMHTGSLVSCVNCEKLFGTDWDVRHRDSCDITEFQNGVLINVNPTKDVKWVTNWRPRISSFLQSISSYDKVDSEDVLTNSSESEEE